MKKLEPSQPPETSTTLMSTGDSFSCKSFSIRDAVSTPLQKKRENAPAPWTPTVGRKAATRLRASLSIWHRRLGSVLDAAGARPRLAETRAPAAAALT